MNLRMTVKTVSLSDYGSLQSLTKRFSPFFTSYFYYSLKRTLLFPGDFI